MMLPFCENIRYIERANETNEGLTLETWASN